ncbi:hypothetical protein Pelo_13822 [Pelomyxa schiedti]|nr:hypothetical protein Pelo_13822 [Pelomyxa schiedti]
MSATPPCSGLGLHRSGSGAWTPCQPSKSPAIIVSCVIVGATNLVQRDDCNDPIVVYRVESREEAQTPVQHNTCDPTWNYSFSIQCRRNQTLSFSVWDYNETTADNFLGATAFSLQEVSAAPTSHALSLSGVEKGVLNIIISCSEPVSNSFATATSPMAPKHNKPLSTSSAKIDVVPQTERSHSEVPPQPPLQTIEACTSAMYQPYPAQPSYQSYPPSQQPGQLEYPGSEPPALSPIPYPTPGYTMYQQPGQLMTTLPGSPSLVPTPVVPTISPIQKIIPNPLREPVEILWCMGFIMTSGSEKKFFSLDKKNKLYKSVNHIMALKPRFEIVDCTTKEKILNGVYSDSGSKPKFILMKGDKEIGQVARGRKIKCAGEKIEMKGELLDLNSHFEFKDTKQIVVSLRREKRYSLDSHVTIPVGSDIALALGIINAISISEITGNNRRV